MITEDEIRMVFQGVPLTRDHIAYLLWAFSELERIPWGTVTSGHGRSPYLLHTGWMNTILTAIDIIANEANPDATVDSIGFVPVHLRGSAFTWIWVPTGRFGISLDRSPHSVGSSRFTAVRVNVEDLEEEDQPFNLTIDEVVVLLDLPQFDQDHAAEGCWEARSFAEKQALEAEASEADAEQAGFTAEEQCIDELYREWSNAVEATLDKVLEDIGLYSKRISNTGEGDRFLLQPTLSWAAIADALAYKNGKTLLEALREKIEEAGFGYTPRRYIVAYGLDDLIRDLSELGRDQRRSFYYRQLNR